MKLWLISQTMNDDYDTYDSAVVAAETEDEARLIQPSEYEKWGEKYSSWCEKPEQVTVKLIGDAIPETVAGVICASFNAG